MAETNELTETLITLTADIVSAHVSNNSVAVSDLPSDLEDVVSELSPLVFGRGLPAPRRAVRWPLRTARHSWISSENSASCRP